MGVFSGIPSLEAVATVVMVAIIYFEIVLVAISIANGYFESAFKNTILLAVAFTTFLLFS